MMMRVVSEGWNEERNDSDMGVYGICGPTQEEREKAKAHCHNIEVESVGVVHVYPVMRRLDFLDMWGYEWHPSMSHAEEGCSGEFFGYCEGVSERDALNHERIIRLYNEYMMNAE